MSTVMKARSKQYVLIQRGIGFGMQGLQIVAPKHMSDVELGSQDAVDLIKDLQEWLKGNLQEQGA